MLFYGWDDHGLEQRKENVSSVQIILIDYVFLLLTLIEGYTVKSKMEVWSVIFLRQPFTLKQVLISSVLILNETR